MPKYLRAFGPIVRYFAALLFISLAILARYALSSLTGLDISRFLTLLPIILAISLVYGARVGLFATFISAGYVYFAMFGFSIRFGPNWGDKFSHLAEFTVAACLLAVYSERHIKKERDKQQEKRRRESERQFQQLADSIPQLVWIADCNGEVTWYNQRFYSYTGKSYSELKGWGWKAVHDPQVLPKVVESWKECLRNEQPFEMTYPLRGADGRLRPFLTRVVPVRDETGTVLHWFGTNTDISEQKRNEELLREKEEQFTAFMDNSPGLAWIKDSSGRYLYCNRRFGESFAVSPEAIIGKSDFELWPADVAGQFVHSDDDAKAAKDFIVAKEEVKMPYRTTIWRTYKFPFAGSEGDIHVGGFAVDVTEAERLQSQLAERERQLKLWLENAPAALAIFDKEMRYLTASNRWISDYGLQGRKLIGVSHYEIFPEISERWKQFHRRGLAGEVVKMEEDSFPREDGTVQWLRWEIHPWYDQSNRIGGIVIFSEDLTHRKRAELDLLKAQSDLVEAQRLEALGRLTGGVAHDFNNLLTVVLAHSELLRNSNDAATVQRAKKIAEAARRGSELTQQLLAVGRRQVLQPTVQRLDEVISSMAQMLHRVLGERIRVEFSAVDGIWPVRVDRNQFERAVLDLAINAKDAMPDGGALRLSLVNIKAADSGSHHWRVEEGNYVLLTVADTGVGIDPELKLKIFEPFFTTKPSGKGSGLGLATVFGTVKQSGGYIFVESEPGQGSSFFIYLPAIVSDGVLLAKHHSSGRTENSRAKVLVVDDQDQLRMVIAEQLRAAGHDVLEASSISSAIEVGTTEGAKLDIILTDVILEDGNGKKLVEDLRLKGCNPTPIYMSGYTDDLIEEHGVLAENVLFLQKPFTRKLLLATLAKAQSSKRDSGQ